MDAEIPQICAHCGTENSAKAFHCLSCGKPLPLGEAVEAAQPPEKPDTNLFAAIMVTLFCFLPTGLTAVICIALSDARWAKGDYEGAERAARLARLLTGISVLAGVVLGLVGNLLFFLSMGSEY